MKPIGIDLGVIDGNSRPRDVATCPGANLRVTREELASYRAGGEVFQPTEIPSDGRGDARVSCRSPVETGTSPIGYPVVYGLCRSCSDLEARHRKLMRRLAEVARR